MEVPEPNSTYVGTPRHCVVPKTHQSARQSFQLRLVGGATRPPQSVGNNTYQCGVDRSGGSSSVKWTCGGCVREDDVSDCPDKNTWGLTYDDGPALYTPNLLQYLDQQNLKSTFFAVGSRVISYPALLQEEYMSGHQIAVHTWSHPAMTTVSTEGIIAELGWTKKVIKDTLGVTPIYWRPPYGDIDDRVRAIGMAMNLYPVMWTRISATQTFDTLGPSCV